MDRPGTSADTQGATLLATLGGQPQIVTFALDLLLARGIPIRDVLVVHPADASPRLSAARERLAAEFVGDRYAGAPCRFRTIPLRGAGGPLEDITNEESTQQALDTIHDLIRSLKQQRQHVHACISGGRRIMALLTISAAILHFDHLDCLWHVFTPDALHNSTDEGAIMHAPQDAGVRLIQIPLVPWGLYIPGLRDLATGSAETVRQSQMAHLDERERRCCADVLAHLTKRQLDVLVAFAAGLRPQQVAERLRITLGTVDDHKTIILAHCRNAWALSPDATLDYRFLYDKFKRYFSENHSPP